MTTNTNPSGLQFRRTTDGVYANGTDLRYYVDRDGKRWLLSIWTTRRVAGAVVASDCILRDFHDTQGLGKAVAHAFEALAETMVNPLDHSARLRLAVAAAYAQ